MKYNKIHIVGIYGTGKSTLAEKVKKILKYKVYDLDEIKYKRKYDKIRTVKQRLKIIKQISNKRTWITEGAWLDYAKELYKKADIVVFLHVSKPILYKRFLFRYFKRKISKEKYYENNLKTTFSIMKKIKKYFEDPNYFLTLNSHKNYIKKHAKKYIILKNKKQIKEFLNNLK